MGDENHGPEQVILVNRLDEAIGIEEKLHTHRSGLLHRAFSIFVADPTGRILLQRRATNKYHSGDLWSNTVCGHPIPGENIEEAAHRRLQEEMGFDCHLKKVHQLIYNIPVTGQLAEHELNHVFVGEWEGLPRPNSLEVAAWRWQEADSIDESIAEHPDRFSAWFPPIWASVKSCVTAPSWWRGVAE